MRDYLNAKFIFGSLLLICFSIALAGCGKKGPPLPPIVKGNKIAAPSHFKYKSHETSLTLSWQHKTDPEKASVKPDGFEVFMAKKTFDDCEGCPFKFSLLKYVPMPETACTVKIEKGFRYYFRVQAVNDKNIRSEYTRTVQFENP